MRRVLTVFALLLLLVVGTIVGFAVQDALDVQHPQIDRIRAGKVSALKPAPTPTEEAATPEPTPEPDPELKGMYCVREGGFPNGGYTEDDYPDCTWVDKVEDVPPGKPCLPSGCDSTDPEGTRHFWESD